MNWKNLACLFVTIVGVILFLYGSNYYDAVTGFAGLFLFIGGIAAFFAMDVYSNLKKKRVD
jgi:hypothetical protein